MAIGDWEQVRDYQLKIGDVIVVDYLIDGYDDLVICTVDEVDSLNLYVAYIHPWANEVMRHVLRRADYVYWRLKD
jgi:hypothetical protein